MKAFMMTTLFLVLSLFAQASDSFKDKYEAGIKNKITPLFKSYDNSASVYVDIEFTGQKGQLPLTPFLFENIDLSESGRVKLTSLEVTIVSGYDEFPQGIMNVTNKILSDYGVQPKFNFVKISKNVVTESSFNIGYALVAFAFIMMAAMIYIVNRQRISNMAALNSKLADSIASVGENFSGGQKQESNNGVQEIKVDTSSSNHWEEMDIESINELLMDCYWSQKDQYANYIWSKVSMATKKELLTKSSYLVDYISFLEDVTPENLGKELESYYMKPLNLAHLSNEEVKGLVFKFTGFFNSLSSIRKESIDVSASERLDLMSQEKAAHFEIPSEKSSARKLVKKVLIFPKSVEEEMELFDSDKLNEDQKKSIVSLHWLSELSKDDVANILSSFTAKQIASVWIGPEAVLTKIEKCIPPKKLKLVKSYIESVSQNRESEVFKEIYEESLKVASVVSPVKEAA